MARGYGGVRCSTSGPSAPRWLRRAETIRGSCHESSLKAWCSSANAVGGHLSLSLDVETCKTRPRQMKGRKESWSKASACSAGLAGLKPSLDAAMKVAHRPGERAHFPVAAPTSWHSRKIRPQRRGHCAMWGGTTGRCAQRRSSMGATDNLGCPTV